MLRQSKIINPVSSRDILPFILAVDLGTLSVRVAAIDADGKILALLPMNGSDEFRGSRGVPRNSTFDEALSLCREAGIPRLLGHHFGMFEFNDVDPLELAKRQDAAVATGFPRVDEVCFCRRDHGSIGMQP